MEDLILNSSMLTNDRPVISTKVLEHSRTVVERKDYVSTGVLTHAEGDLLEIEIAEFKDFQLGESVKITIYSPAGIHILHSSVIGKHEGSIIIIHPPNHQKKFEDKRKYPRVDTDREGSVLQIDTGGSSRTLDIPIRLFLRNISLQGVGFQLLEDPVFKIDTKMRIELDLGFTLPCMIEVVRREKSESGSFYGAQLLDLSEDYLRNLRAFILKQQIENHYKYKSELKRDFG